MGFLTQSLNYLDFIRILPLPQPEGLASLPSIFPSCLQQDDEINQQSQLIEKLKQQMLDQEEVRGKRARHERRGVCVHPWKALKKTFLQSDGRRGILLGLVTSKTIEVWDLTGALLKAQMWASRCFFILLPYF